MKYMLDANVLRHIAARDVGYKNIIANIQRAGINNILVSVIVAAELHKAIHNHKLERAERQAIKQMLDALSLVYFNEDDAEAAGKLAAELLRKGRTVSAPRLPDCRTRAKPWLCGGHGQPETLRRHRKPNR